MTGGQTMVHPSIAQKVQFEDTYENENIKRFKFDRNESLQNKLISMEYWTHLKMIEIYIFFYIDSI